MTQYIDKSALVAEIDNLLDKCKYHEEYDCAYRDGNNGALYALKGKLDTLEVKEVHKEPVSEKKCIFTKDNYTDEERKVLCDGCEEECEYNKKEPVSEDLEEASKEWLRQQLDKSYANYGEAKMMELTYFDGYAMLDAIEFGAEWQKAKDESTTEDLGGYINELSKQFPEVSFAKLSRIAVRVAKWQIEHLWKHADGNDLPIFDREVIALLDNGKVVFAHRPPEYWDGKNIITGEVTRYYPKTYDKGGWNIPNVKWWLDVYLPKEIEL